MNKKFTFVSSKWGLFFFKKGNLIFSIKLGQRLPKSFSQLHVKDSGFFLSYFLKKDDWPNAYAGPRLPTLLYLGVFSMTNLKFNNVHSHGGSLVDVIYKVNLHHFASSMRKLCFREKKSRLHLSNYYTYKWVEISSWHLVHPWSSHVTTFIKIDHRFEIIWNLEFFEK